MFNVVTVNGSKNLAYRVSFYTKSSQYFTHLLGTQSIYNVCSDHDSASGWSLSVTRSEPQYHFPGSMVYEVRWWETAIKSLKKQKGLYFLYICKIPPEIYGHSVCKQSNKDQDLLGTGLNDGCTKRGHSAVGQVLDTVCKFMHEITIIFAMFRFH
jgi:hypothetical protein